jgi:hypothetical protein
VEEPPVFAEPETSPLEQLLKHAEVPGGESPRDEFPAFPTETAAEAETFGRITEPEDTTRAGEPDQFTLAEPEPAAERTAPEESESTFGFPGLPLEGELAVETPAAETVEPSTGEGIDPFGMMVEPAAPTVEGTEESLEAFTDRMRSELAGTENSLSLEEYLNLPRVSASGAANEIEDLAQKLSSAGRITPIINLSERTAAAPEEETPATAGFVTPTLAEIYAKQGWYDDAIKAYRTLAVNKPAERERFEQRIRELEALKKEQGET